MHSCRPPRPEWPEALEVWKEPGPEPELPAWSETVPVPEVPWGPGPWGKRSWSSLRGEAEGQADGVSFCWELALELGGFVMVGFMIRCLWGLQGRGILAA